MSIIKQNINKYPLCEARDIIKLIYQNEFGNGHMLASKNKIISMIELEYNKSLIPYPLFESIGNHYYRLNLSKAKDLDIPPSLIANVFIDSSKYGNGNKDMFCLKVEAFIDLCEHYAINKDDALSIFNYIKENNYCPISHSERYKKAYMPAYRLVRKNVVQNYLVDFTPML